VAGGVIGPDKSPADGYFENRLEVRMSDGPTREKTSLLLQGARVPANAGQVDVTWSPGDRPGWGWIIVRNDHFGVKYKFGIAIQPLTQAEIDDFPHASPQDGLPGQLPDAYLTPDQTFWQLFNCWIHTVDPMDA